MSISIRDLNDNTRKDLELFLRNHTLENLYILYDLENEDKRAIFTIAYSVNSVVGVLLTYTLPNHPILWLVGEVEAAESLLSAVRFEKFVMIAEKQHLELINSLFGNTKCYEESIMYVSSKEARISRNTSARKLSPGDFRPWARSRINGEKPDNQQLLNSMKELEENDCFGIFIGDEIVSRGVVQAKASGGWAIGGVYTLPDFRNKGYATEVVAQIVNYGSKYNDDFVLFVRKDNVPAVASYKKIGFKAIGERYYIDYNTGSVP